MNTYRVTFHYKDGTTYSEWIDADSEADALFSLGYSAGRHGTSISLFNITKITCVIETN